MDLEKLSAADQALLNTDFGEDMEKEAAAMVKMASDCYAKGAEMALEIADDMDKLAAEEKKDDDKDDGKMDEESEKAAAELGAFTDRGTWDTLLKLGSERHGDPSHYILPFVEQKVAEAGAHAALKKFAGKKDQVMNFIRGVADKAKDKGGALAAKAKAGAGAAATKAKEVGHRAAAAANPATNVRAAATGVKSAVGKHGGKRDFALGTKGRVAEGAKAVGKVGTFGALAYGGARAATKKKED
jgi:hypothetical protein